MKKNRSILLAPTIFFISSCINLQHVHDFSSESAATLANESDIGYSFYQSCLDFDCQPGPAMLDAQLTLPEKQCNCDTFQLADKTMLIFNKVIYGYLNTMAQLSDGKKVNYDYTSLTKSINADAIQGKLNITSDQVNAVSKLATDLTNKVMNAYRKKKLQQVIAASNPDFQKAMDAYIVCVRDFLRDQAIENSLSRLKNNYSTYLKLNQSLLSPDAKGKLLKEYFYKKNTLEKYGKLATKYVQSLETIKAGHQSVSNETGHLDKASVISLLIQYATDIKTLNEEFKSIKKVTPLN